MRMRLNIPGGWAVTYNQFMDENPVIEDGKIANWDVYKEDLLQISKLEIQDGWHQIPDLILMIDLGFYPEADPEGNFRLVLTKVDKIGDTGWQEIEEFESKDRFAVRDKIEQWMQQH